MKLISKHKSGWNWLRIELSNVWAFSNIWSIQLMSKSNIWAYQTIEGMENGKRQYFCDAQSKDNYDYQYESIKFLKPPLTLQNH